MVEGSRRKPRTKTKRRVRITEQFAADICELILEWRGPLTWGRVVEEVERVCGQRWTRQALHKHDRIQQAYQDKRKTLKTRAPVAEGDIARMILLEKIERQESEIRNLLKCVHAYDELFIRYQANAHRLSIAPAELEKPLPPVERRNWQREETGGKHSQGISLVRPTIPDR